MKIYVSITKAYFPIKRPPEGIAVNAQNTELDERRNATKWRLEQARVIIKTYWKQKGKEFKHKQV